MSFQIKTFTVSDGYSMHFRHWAAAPDDGWFKGYVVALHGIQSHSGWYHYSSERMQDAGFDVRFLDRRGSGLNQQDRGHAEHHERLVNDVVQFLHHLRSERDATDASRPIYLLAVSWGAKIATALAIQFPELIDGLVLLYPGLCPSVRPAWHQKKLLSTAVVAGKTRRMVRIPLDDPALFTSDSQSQKFIAEDELSVHEVSVGFFQAGRKLDEIIEQRAAEVRCPLWMALAGDDAIIDNKRTAELFKKFGSKDKTLVTWDGCRHTFEFEPNREQIFSALVDVLNGWESPTT